MRKLVLLLGILVALIAAPTAVAAPEVASVFGGDLTCAEVTADGNVAGATGQTWCGSIRAGDDISSTLSDPLPSDRSTTKTFDGVPLDVNVAFPDTGSAPYPVVGIFHGYGGSKMSFRVMQRYLDRGYAAYSLSQRGFGESCGSQDSRDADPAGCQKGYVHLMDLRYEVRDTQLLLGKLVDQGLIDPDRIAATGGSYGGGMSLELAALKDRTMLLDGTLVPWESPNGTAMSLAVATPTVPWSDLSYALAPNGSNLDYIEDAGYHGRTGVMKESYVQGLSAQGFKAPQGSDPRADILGWKAILDAGEPYDTNPDVRAMTDEVSSFHSAYGVDHSRSPAPLLIASGFTDDLFPVNEATRFYNRTRAEHPDSPLALFFASFGHPRGQNQFNVTAAREALEDEWIDHYLKGTGPAPDSDVTTYTQSCPYGQVGGGPHVASDWASIAPGEIRLVDDGGPQTVAPDGGDPDVAAAFNPITSSNPCTTAPGAEESGTANYELPAAPANGYTVMGAATVIADITLPGDNSQIAARLVDVAPDGKTKILIERGLWRPANKGLQVFQLFANGWKVEAGHVLRLELLPKDAKDGPGGVFSNYGRPSNGQEQAKINDVDLRVPVLESPGSLGGLVTAPKPRVLPSRPGVELAPGYGEAVSIKGGKLKVAGKPKVKGKRVKVKVACKGSGHYSCKARLKLVGAPKGKHARGRNAVLVRGKDIRARDGRQQKLSLKLTKRGRKLFGGRNGVKSLRTEVFIRGESAGFTRTKRAGKGN